MEINNLLTPAQVHEYTLNTGVNKTSMSLGQTLVLSILAGAYIAFAGIGSMISSFAVDNASISALLSGLVFSVGLMMIVVAGGELFTGNVLIAVAVMNGKVKLSRYVQNLVLVLVGNFIGAALIAWMADYIGIPGKGQADLATALMNKGLVKLQMSFGVAFVSGILCNLLVSLAVWMTYAAKDISGKIFAALFPIMVFALSGYEHIVANCYYLPAAFFAAGNSTWAAHAGAVASAVTQLGWASLPMNMIPVTLGNVVGGLLIAGGYQLAYRTFSKKK